MRIIGFGDSFMQPVGYTDINDHHYMKLFADKIKNTEYRCCGIPGSGIWDTFFSFKKFAESKEYDYNFDVCVFVWSEKSRLYNSTHRNVCYTKSLEYENSNDPFWTAVKYYYEYLEDVDKNEHEFTSFFYWLDDWLLENYPNVKFIHMYSFPKKTESSNSGDYFNIIKNHPEKEIYFHKFKNSVTILPSLLHFSLNDGWPKDNDLSKENRFQHLTPKMHSKIANLLTKSLHEYWPGKIIQDTQTTEKVKKIKRLI